MQIDNLILGAGIAGLAYAYEKRNEKTVVFEAQSFAGGLCHSFNIQGFTFDSAVHLSFTENSIARSFFDTTPYIKHEPVVCNFYKGYWVKHPLLNNLYLFNIPDKVVYIKSFVERKSYKHITNYGEWLQASYGEEIAKRFYYVYTKKYWTVKPEALTTSWLGTRLNAPDIEKILFGAFSSNTGNDYYAKEMRYPSGSGGYETFLEPLIRGAPIEYNKQAIKVNLKKKYVECSDGTRCTYKKLASSIPLLEFVKIMEPAPLDLVAKVNTLKASKISIVSIGLNKPDIAKYLWFYIYDEDIMAARVNCPGVKSKDNVPPGCSSMQFEIYHHPDEVVNREVIIENTLQGIKKMNLCDDEDIIFVDYRLLPYGNVLFLHDMERNRECVKKYIVTQGVDLIGRFGEWDYLWSDQSYLSGKKHANRGKYI
jgi:protoporphyrinogen oxidase